MRALCTNCDSREIGHWCSQCGAILPTPEDENYFSILGLPQKINLDEVLLKERFFDLNRAFHPDRAVRIADEHTREIALQKSVLINNGFNTLRDRTRRIQYLIRQELGEREEKTGHIPIQLFDLVEQVNELMVRMRAAKVTGASAAKGIPDGNASRLVEVGAQLEEQLKELTAHREAFEQSLRAKESEWDALCDLTRNFEHMDEVQKAKQHEIMQSLAVKMNEVSYIDSLIRRIKDTLYE
jgi:molecular chaperone HscB